MHPIGALLGGAALLGAVTVLAACSPSASVPPGASGRGASGPGASGPGASGPGASGPEASGLVSPAASERSAASWDVLFDGGSTDAFRAYGGDAFPSVAWTVDGNALRTVGGSRVDLISKETYADFELEFEWRVGNGGNGGVMYRVAESPDPSWTSGPEYQVLDNVGHPDGQRPETSAAALYDLIAPAADTALAPVGEYNMARIVVRDGRAEHWLNGKLALAYDWGEAATRRLIADSKFRDLPGFMAEDVGHIVLQHHGLDAWYRNVRIRRLDTK